MIRSLLYLTATRPDIQFAVCLYARFQASPRMSHRQAVKRIFRYLRFTPEFGLWYSASSSLSLFVAILMLTMPDVELYVDPPQAPVSFWALLLFRGHLASSP